MSLPIKKINTSHYTIYLDDGGYKLLQEHIDENQYSSLFILVDNHTKEDCLPVFLSKIPRLAGIPVIEIPSGEEHKNLESLKKILLDLSHYGADRKSLLLNLGGGVITDIGGFAASIFKRGIKFINLPTTLLSMVDASVGGKTGIDLDDLKNQVGTFSFPEMIIVDQDYLKTLPEREFISGFAEMLKHGLIAQSTLWETLYKINDINVKSISPFIEESIAVKKEIVEDDPYEKGLRKILNYGHTIGHAIESFYLQKNNKYLHGEAIAMGMICEAYLSYKKNLLSENDLNIITQKLIDTYKVLRRVEEKDFNDLLAWIKHDKKNEGEQINFSLLNGIGNCEFNLQIDPLHVIESLQFYNSSLQEIRGE